MDDAIDEQITLRQQVINRMPFAIQTTPSPYAHLPMPSLYKMLHPTESDIDWAKNNHDDWRVDQLDQNSTETNVQSSKWDTYVLDQMQDGTKRFLDVAIEWNKNEGSTVNVNDTDSIQNPSPVYETFYRILNIHISNAYVKDAKDERGLPISSQANMNELWSALTDNLPMEMQAYIQRVHEEYGNQSNIVNQMVEKWLTTDTKQFLFRAWVRPTGYSGPFYKIIDRLVENLNETATFEKTWELFGKSALFETSVAKMHEQEKTWLEGLQSNYGHWPFTKHYFAYIDDPPTNGGNNEPVQMPQIGDGPNPTLAETRDSSDGSRPPDLWSAALDGWMASLIREYTEGFTRLCDRIKYTYLDEILLWYQKQHCNSLIEIENMHINLLKEKETESDLFFNFLTGELQKCVVNNNQTIDVNQIKDLLTDDIRGPWPKLPSPSPGGPNGELTDQDIVDYVLRTVNLTFFNNNLEYPSTKLFEGNEFELFHCMERIYKELLKQLIDQRNEKNNRWLNIIRRIPTRQIYVRTWLAFRGTKGQLDEIKPMFEKFIKTLYTDLDGVILQQRKDRKEIEEKYMMNSRDFKEGLNRTIKVDRFNAFVKRMIEAKNEARVVLAMMENPKLEVEMDPNMWAIMGDPKVLAVMGDPKVLAMMGDPKVLEMMMKDDSNVSKAFSVMQDPNVLKMKDHPVVRARMTLLSRQEEEANKAVKYNCVMAYLLALDDWYANHWVPPTKGQAQAQSIKQFNRFRTAVRKSYASNLASSDDRWPLFDYWKDYVGEWCSNMNQGDRCSNMNPISNEIKYYQEILFVLENVKFVNETHWNEYWKMVPKAPLPGIDFVEKLGPAMDSWVNAGTSYVPYDQKQKPDEPFGSKDDDDERMNKWHAMEDALLKMLQEADKEIGDEHSAGGDAALDERFPAFEVCLSVAAITLYFAYAWLQAYANDASPMTMAHAVRVVAGIAVKMAIVTGVAVAGLYFVDTMVLSVNRSIHATTGTMVGIRILLLWTSIPRIAMAMVAAFAITLCYSYATIKLRASLPDETKRRLVYTCLLVSMLVMLWCTVACILWWDGS